MINKYYIIYVYKFKLGIQTLLIGLKKLGSDFAKAAAAGIQTIVKKSKIICIISKMQRVIHIGKYIMKSKNFKIFINMLSSVNSISDLFTISYENGSNKNLERFINHKPSGYHIIVNNNITQNRNVIIAVTNHKKGICQIIFHKIFITKKLKYKF